MRKKNIHAGGTDEPLSPLKALREERFGESDVRGILDHSLDGLVVLDEEGVVCYVNPAAEEIFGKDKDAFLGMDFGFPVTLGKTTEIKIFRRARGHRTVELKSTAFSWRDGQPATLLSLRDITDRRKLEEEVMEKEREKSYLMDNMADVVLTVDENASITSINRTGKELFGLSEQELLNCPIHKIFPEDAFAQWFERQRRLRGGVFPSDLDSHFLARKADGSALRMEISLKYMDINDWKGFVFAARDITGRLEMERKLKVMSEAVKQSLWATLLVDVGGKVEYVNEKFLSLASRGQAEVVGRRVDEVLKPLGISLTLPAPEEAEASVTTESLYIGDDQAVWVEQYVSPIRDADGSVTHYLISQEDVTQRIKLKDELETRSLRDPFTGLLNKAGLVQEIHRVTTGKLDLSSVFLFHINIDHFSVINDTCGQEAGDRLLVNLTRILEKAARDASPGRLESDTFILFCSGRSEEEARESAENILRQVRDLRFVWEENVFNPSVTITLMSLEEWSKHESVGALFQALSTASRMAKNKGGDKVYFIQSWDEEIRLYHRYTHGISLVHKALDQNLFCLFYQPITSLRGAARGHSYEVLIRIRDGDDFVLPNRFLPAVEKYHIGYKVDQWVINHILEWLARNPQHLGDLDHCGINVSAESITSPAFLDFVAGKIEEYAIPPDKLCFEITETSAVENFAVANRHLGKLRRMGCKIALDDFGTGMSSFSYLKKFEIDYLKIDGAFIRDLKNDPVDFAMVNAIQNLGRHMGIKTIAEFVEDEETLNILRLLGIDFVQGYHMGKPVFLC